MPDTGVDTFADWYVHTVDVDTIGAPDEFGATPVTSHVDVACWIEDKVQLVRGPDGAETVSTATLWLPLERRDWFTPGSVVHLAGRDSQVISVSAGDSTTGDSLDGIAVTLA